jgi:hypothetical protein
LIQEEISPPAFHIQLLISIYPIPELMVGGSILAQENIPMIQIQAILRHKNLATTERYITRLSDLKPDLRVLSNEKAV